MKEKSQLITNKIDELIALARVENDNNTLIVLLGLQGSRNVDMDGLFARETQKTLMNVMMPALKAQVIAIQAANN